MAVEVTQNLTQVTISSVGVAGVNGTSGTSGFSIDSGSFVTTSSYQTDSASFANRIESATNEQDLSYLATTGSNTFNGNQIISGSIYMGTGSIILSNGTEIYDTGDATFNTTGIGLGGNGFKLDFGSNENDWARFIDVSNIQMEPTNQFGIIITGVGEYGWFFDANGLSYPDGTTQTTAYPGPIETGSFATTGSNTFVGNQTISGSILLEGDRGINFGTNNTYVGMGEGALYLYDSTGYIQIDAQNDTNYSQLILAADNQQFLYISDYTDNATLIYTKSGSLLLNGVSYDAHLATTGSNTFVGNQTINGNIGSNVISANSIDLAAPSSGQGENGALDITNGPGYEMVFKGDTPTNILHAGTSSLYIGNTANPTLLQLFNNNLILNNATMLGTASWADNVTTAVNATTAVTASYSVNLVVSESMTVAGIGIGRGAGQNVSNIAFGDGALESNTIGSNNVAIGKDAFRVNTEGIRGIAIGIQALEYNETGNANVAIGPQAMQFNTTGQGNVAIGFQTLDANVGGNYNVGLGLSSLGKNTSGGGNVGVGISTLAQSNVGNNNTAIGYGAGQALATGSGNIFVGAGAGPFSLSDVSNRLYIDNSGTDTPLIYGEFDNDVVVVNGNLSVTGTDTTIVLPNHASAPTSPASGALYFNTTDFHFYGWNGGAWVQLDN